jgi:hypothetical protein
MKIFDTGIKFFALLMLAFLITNTSCQKEEQNDDLTQGVIGNYNGEYREGDGSFTVIVSNVTASVSKTSENSFDVEMELIPGLVVVDFSAEMQSENRFTVNAFLLDGDELEGEGTLDGNILDISFFEKGTTKLYSSYIAEKQ